MGWIHNAPDNTSTDGPMIVAVMGVLTGVSFCFICLRAYVRGRLIHALGIDDWIIFVTWLLTCSFVVVAAIQTKWGLGMKHVEDMPSPNIYPFGNLEYAGSALYILSVLGFKQSLLVSYFRFVPQGMCKYGVTCVLVSCTLFHVACLIVQLNLCHPIAKQWDSTITDGKCVNLIPFYTSSSSLTIVFDFAVMFLPFPVLIKTKIQKRKKVVLLGLFALGFFITVIQIIRIQFMKGLANPLNSGSVILWSAVEVNLGVIVACVPVLSPLFKQKPNSRKNTPESSLGNNTAPGSARYSCRIIQQRIPSEDNLFDSEDNDTNRITNINSREPILSPGDKQIVKETDIVVINQLAPAHLASHDTELGRTRVRNYECWAGSANGVPV
ncbi:hypothetical protein F5Y13DRAFT_172566 [Hypoxylon sp. FL1857]|nr:hypothetical protein F5Y13DRAFT_172566 [Hypoxylon sp. FL1857]